MLRVTVAAHRATAGPVFWVVAGVTRDRCYWPGCEGLAWEWWKRGGDCQMYRPCIYRRVGIPGSGGDDYLRADWEYVLCFKHAGKLPFADNTAMGHPPKWAPGGEMSHRLTNGQRVNGEKDPWMKRGRGNNLGGRKADGTKNKGTTHTKSRRQRAEEGEGMVITGPGERKEEEQAYIPPAIANPGTCVQELYQFTAEEISRFIGQPADIVDCVVGGGRMGSDLASENEAPYPERLPEFFIRSFSRENDIIGDCFSGSGTTLVVATRWNRRFAGCDIRQSQVDLSLKRVATETPLALFADNQGIS